MNIDEASVASHSCTEERKSAIGSRKFNRYLLAIYDYRLAMFNIAPKVQECDARGDEKRYIARLKNLIEQ